MEITIKINGRMTVVEVSAEVAVFFFPRWEQSSSVTAKLMCANRSAVLFLSAFEMTGR